MTAVKKGENELSPQSSSHRINTSIGDNLSKTVKENEKDVKPEQRFNWSSNI